MLVVTKADIATPEQVERQLVAAATLADFDDEVVVSAVEGFNVDGFVETRRAAAARRARATSRATCAPTSRSRS